MVLGKTQTNSFPSALHFAIMSGNIEMVTLLLNYGADMTIADSIYGNALHLCTCYRIGTENQAQMVELLLKRGANPNAIIKNAHGATLRTPIEEFFRRLYKFSVSFLHIVG
jgi:ankyrin repeat protein